MGDDGGAPRAYAPEMRMRAVLLALASVAVVASAGGCGHASRSSPLPAPRSYSVRQVKAAFAAAGMPLAEVPVPGSKLGYTFLDSPAYVESGIEFSVTVNPRSSAFGDPYAWSASAVGSVDVPDADIDASATGNVVVVFDRRSPSAPRIRAALARLRRM